MFGIDHILSCGLQQKDFKVVRLVSDLLIAATDTTSITATWLLYILSQHQHIQAIFLLEVQKNFPLAQEVVRKELPKDNSIGTSQQVMKEPYTMDWLMYTYIHAYLEIPIPEVLKKQHIRCQGCKDTRGVC